MLFAEIMSRCIFNQLKCCRSRFTQSNYTLTSTTGRTFARGNNDKQGGLGHTTILVQQGCDIQELPVIMRKFGQDELVALCSNAGTGVFDEGHTVAGVPINTTTDPDIAIKRLENCVSTTGILSTIDDIPVAEMTPEIAVFALDKLIRISSLIQLKNLEDSNEVYMKIVACITQKSDTKTLLDTLDILRMFSDMKWTIQKLCDELLTRNSDEILTIVEICESIHKFVQCKQPESAEKFWSGFADQEKQITAENIKFIYQALPKLKVSRRMVIGVLERNITNLFWNLSPEAVVEILSALVQCNASPFRTMHTLSRWLNTNIHAVTESNLEAILKSFTDLDYSDQQIEKAIERYVKAKSVKIKAQVLIVELLNHCVKFRLRNTVILNGCGEYFAANTALIEPGYLKSFICPFGELAFEPANGLKFWKALESFLDENFDQINPTECIAIMLTCVYLEKYPLNFVNRIFNPHFLDTIHSTTPILLHPRIRSDLKLFDTALSIECNNYNGPMLPRDHSAKSIWQDGRIKRIVQNLNDQWTAIAGAEDRFSKSVVHQQLPLNPLYVIDVLIHPAGMGQLWKFNSHTDRNIYVACLIQLPEHYDSERKYLSGPQAMRIRHMRMLGLKVVTLDYETLAKLRVHAKELHKYLVERMKSALPAID